jgi:hypothetical protein
MFDHTPFAETWPARATTNHDYTLLTSFCELSLIMERIYHLVYAVYQPSSRVTEVAPEVVTLQKDLDLWRHNLPPHLDSIASRTNSPPLPYNLSLL